jgi:putative phosphoribosyl transferase
MLFHDRTDAGRRLATQVAERHLEAPIVVALPRGGVPVGYEIARALEAPLDVLIARKLGAPGHPELAIGAVAEGGGFYLNLGLAAEFWVTEPYLQEVARAELAEVERRRIAYRAGKPTLDVQGRSAIIVDDGLATGATMSAAVRALRKQDARALVVAVPVCAPTTATQLHREGVEVICAMAPLDFEAVGACYEEFEQTSDQEVVELLRRAEAELHARAPRAEAAGRMQ